MMSLGKRYVSMFVLATAALAIGVSACAGGGDDDDDDNTPLPNPYEACFMFWDHYYQTDAPVKGHRMYVAGLTEDWVTGTLNFGTGETDGIGQMLYDVTFGAGGTTVAVYLSTNGSASITAPSNSLGQPVEVSLATAPSWVLTEGTGGNATGGTGDASGFFNDGDDCFGQGDPEDCIDGTGDATIMIGSTALTIGESSTPGVGFTLGFCEDLSAFDGTWRERADHLARTLPPFGL